MIKRKTPSLPGDTAARLLSKRHEICKECDYGYSTRTHADPTPAHKIAEAWNTKHAVGTTVRLTQDGGSVVTTRTRSEAFASRSGTPVIFLEDVSGYYLLDRVTPVE